MSRFCKIGTAAYNGIHPEMLEAVAAGKFKGIEKLITRKIAIEDLVEKGIMALLHEKDKHGQYINFQSNNLGSLMHLNSAVKILVHPWSTEYFFLVCTHESLVQSDFTWHRIWPELWCTCVSGYFMSGLYNPFHRVLISWIVGVLSGRELENEHLTLRGPFCLL